MGPTGCMPANKPHSEKDKAQVLVAQYCCSFTLHARLSSLTSGILLPAFVHHSFQSWLTSVHTAFMPAETSEACLH